MVFGKAAVSTFSREEMLATKLRALLQRNKGRDLYDLAHALKVFEGLNTSRVASVWSSTCKRKDYGSHGRRPRSGCSRSPATWTPDRPPSVAVNGGREGTDGTSDQKRVCQGPFRTGRSTARRSVGQTEVMRDRFGIV